MSAFLAIIAKEFLLLRRDIHGLLLLFLMPLAFILIMSLALQNAFSGKGGVTVDVLLDDQAGTAESAAVLNTLHDNPAFAWQTAGPDAEQRIARDEAAFLLVLVSDDNGLQARVRVAPGTAAATESLFTASLREALARERVRGLLQTLNPDAGADELNTLLDSDAVQVSYSYGDSSEQAPSSVQQSVPAWLVFAMFFAVVPLSNAFIGERQQGTLKRLRTLPIPAWLPLAGKLLPYFFINQLQAVLMIAVGIWLVPLLGGERLSLGHSLPGLMLMSAAVSLAALGYGMLIATAARTVDQATSLGGAGNIILAALGGVMVPRFVMPEAMQQMSLLSPMAWGLEGFLDIFLRNGGVTEVLPEAGLLALFGLAALGIALLLVQRRND